MSRSLCASGLQPMGISDCFRGDLPRGIRTKLRSVPLALVHQTFTHPRVPSVKVKDTETETHIPFPTMQVQILGQHGENECVLLEATVTAAMLSTQLALVWI